MFPDTDVLPIQLFDVRRIPPGFSRGVAKRLKRNEAIFDRSNDVLKA